MTSEYKLKDINIQDLKPGEKKEVDVEGIEDGKVLLCNVNGKVSALGSKCTHYGAPMVKGILTPDGRLTCPWHGACFKASNGDIENAPALDALPCFNLSERDGSLFVSADKEIIISSRRTPKIEPFCVDGNARVIVVGGGSAALTFVETLRVNGFKGHISMISNEGYLPIDRTKLSKALIDDPEKIFLRDKYWFEKGLIEFIEDEVTAVDFSAQKVITKKGSSHRYNKLVLATGGSPRGLSLSGFNELDGIFVLRNAHQTRAINKAIGQNKKNIVIIGSSFIGLEVANAVVKKNNTTVVGQDDVPLARIMGKEVGILVKRSFEKNGVKFHLSVQAKRALPSESNPSQVGSVELSDGTVLQSDLVILGTGVVPATTFLKNNNAIQLQKDGSVKTNEYFVVDGLADVYAIGDIATFPYHGPRGNGVPVRIEHWNVAQNSGRIAAMHMITPNLKIMPLIPIFWSALGSQVRYCGNSSNGWDDLILKGQPDDFKFVVYYTKGETVVAVGSVGYDPIVAQASELMRRGAMPTKKELLSNVDILK